MYRAKRSGRGQVEVFDDTLRHELRRRYSLEHRLGEAVEGDELHLVYQPIVSLHTGVITAVEALLRWEHPDGTFASPAEFIPIAEETGSIRAVGAWVAAEACRQAAEWEQLGVEPIPVHINVSAVQLRSRSFVEMLRSALSEAGVAPTRMCVELTETVLLDDLERTLERLTALAELGVGIAIDDFGTGYSSLGYLQRFPADLLKIDRSLIATMADDAADIIAEMTVSLAHALNLELVAEGIEAAWQAERVRDLGYHRAQGFHFGHPQAAAELGPQLPRRSGERPRADEVPIVSFQSYCALEQHPAVHMAAAIEVADRGGAEVMAFVVMNPGAPPIAPDALAAWCEERLPAFAIPRYYTVVDRLPKGPSERSSPRRLREWSRSLPTWDRRAGGMRQPITP
jgi:EAL domain-containing protein (putative c-di-GMP-specific phosphodiesterase class I)